ncbi:hypothetical protein [Halomicrobium zhouii]|uniref:hypothetical protein n=1 Tax=Halomicrobium zhouii TaxID=767519 RepID=UPI000B7E23A1|nr:hypothetical protein [Halomicrobium zhouii]
MTEPTASEGATTDVRGSEEPGDRTASDGAMDDGLTGGSELRQIRERAETIRDEAVARAYSQLAARGDLTPEQRGAVAELANRLVENLLAAPACGLPETGETEGAAEAGAVGERGDEANEAVAEIVRELFLE